jgi:hypothetical protein
MPEGEMKIESASGRLRIRGIGIPMALAIGRRCRSWSDMDMGGMPACACGIHHLSSCNFSVCSYSLIIHTVTQATAAVTVTSRQLSARARRHLELLNRLLHDSTRNRLGVLRADQPKQRV